MGTDIIHNSNSLKNKLDYVEDIDSKMTPEDQRVVFTFLMYFNIFEATFFKDDRKYVRDRLLSLNNALSNKDWFSIGKFDSFAKHFAKRYDSDTLEGKNRYDGLHLSSDDYPILLSAITAVSINGCHHEKILYFYLTIAYKFRNNLFHGEKNVEDLEKYREAFTYINQLLSQLMNDMADNNFIKKY
jgi:hypothetical protein